MNASISSIQVMAWRLDRAEDVVFFLLLIYLNFDLLVAEQGHEEGDDT